MVANMIDLPLDIKVFDLMAGEHKTEEFASINPLRIVPTIVDDTDGDQFNLWESRAIMSYFVDRYGQQEGDLSGSPLYPKKIKTRAKINQMLDFDHGTFYSRLTKCFYPLLMGTGKPDPAAEARFKDAVDHLNGFLSDSTFVVDNDMTIADISMRASLSLAEICHFDFSPWINVATWMDRVEITVSGYEEINKEVVDEWKAKVSVTMGEMATNNENE